MAFYPESALASRSWAVQAGETLTVDLRRAGPHERISWAWRDTVPENESNVFPEVAISDSPVAGDWGPSPAFIGPGIESLAGAAAWLRVAVTGAAATVTVLAPGPVEGTVA